MQSFIMQAITAYSFHVFENDALAGLEEKTQKHTEEKMLEAEQAKALQLLRRIEVFYEHWAANSNDEEQKTRCAAKLSDKESLHKLAQKYVDNPGSLFNKLRDKYGEEPAAAEADEPAAAEAKSSQSGSDGDDSDANFEAHYKECEEGWGSDNQSADPDAGNEDTLTKLNIYTASRWNYYRPDSELL